MANVGASPAKKQKTRSYAAVVRSSFKQEPQQQQQAVTSQDQRVSSSGAKTKSQPLDPRRSQQAAVDDEDVLMPLPSELDVQSFLRKLDQALELEVKFRGAAQPPSGIAGRPEAAGSITSGMRDGSAHVLRCLKVWYDLPSDVLFNAISSIDRFLAKMKVGKISTFCISMQCHNDTLIAANVTELARFLRRFISYKTKPFIVTTTCDRNEQDV